MIECQHPSSMNLNYLLIQKMMVVTGSLSFTELMFSLLLLRNKNANSNFDVNYKEIKNINFMFH